MDPLNDFLFEVERSLKGLPELVLVHLARLLTPLVTNKQIINLNNLPQLTPERYNQAVDSRHFYNNDWLAFNEVVCSFIRLGNQLNPWSVLDSFDLYSGFINDLLVAFNNNVRGHLLTNLVRETISIVVPMATRLDRQMYYKENCANPRLTYLASVLLRIFNNIRSQLSADPHDNSPKRQIILLVGVTLCQIYFRLGNPLLCRNIFSNMNNAGLRFSRYSVAEQVQYRFYLSRFYLIKDQLPDAYVHLLWCYETCAAATSGSGQKLNSHLTVILKYLLVVGMMIGKNPSFDTISQTVYNGNSPSFIAIYKDVSTQMKAGNYTQLVAVISQPHCYEFLHKNGLLLLVVNKSKLITVRNLLKKIWILGGKPTRLDYNSVGAGLQVSVNVNAPLDMYKLISGVDDTTIENVLVTLIDQNMLKGKIASVARAVSLSKSDTFPAISEINFRRFGNGASTALNKEDQWMLT